MSTFKPLDDVIKEIENWLRLSTLLHSGVVEALLAILHNDLKDASYTGLPRKPTDLYNELDTTHRVTITDLRNKKVISREQWDNLYPRNGSTSSESFDVTLITVLVINCTTLSPPTTGWNHRKLIMGDSSKGANVLRAREWRNFVHHTDPKTIDPVLFKSKWTEGENLIKALGYHFNANEMKKISLDPKTTTRQQLILKVLNNFCKNTVIDHNKNIKDVQLAIKHHTHVITGLDNKLNIQQLDIQNHDGELKNQQSQIKDHDDKLDVHQKKLDDHDTEIEKLKKVVNRDISVQGINIPAIDKLASKVGEEIVAWINDQGNASSLVACQPHPGSLWLSTLNGTWGRYNGEVCSMYYHPTSKHTATTVGKLGVKPSVALAGDWAVSRQTKALYGNKTSYNTFDN